jgi:hypothetical protein
MEGHDARAQEFVEPDGEGSGRIRRAPKAPSAIARTAIVPHRAFDSRRIGLFANRVQFVGYWEVIGKGVVTASVLEYFQRIEEHGRHCKSLEEYITGNVMVCRVFEGLRQRIPLRETTNLVAS